MVTAVNSLIRLLTQVRERAKFDIVGASARSFNHQGKHGDPQFVKGARNENYRLTPDILRICEACETLLAVVRVQDEALEQIAMPVQLNDSILSRPIDNMTVAYEARAEADRMLAGLMKEEESGVRT